MQADIASQNETQPDMSKAPAWLKSAILRWRREETK